MKNIITYRSTNTILLAIKPEYAEKILNREKTHELRRRIPKHKSTNVLMYAIKPIGKIIGYFTCCYITAPPKELWNMKEVRNGACVSEDMYKKYFEGCGLANAMVIFDAMSFAIPQDITHYGVKHPPQSWVYIQ